MISIDKSKVKKPKNLTHKPCIKALDEVLKSKSGEQINSIYNSIKVKERLLDLYNKKCAYCESRINAATSSVRIDHYRPKDKLKDINSKELSGHNGYYWLGYEWTNFLPTCEICNSKKSNIFPVKQESQRCYEPKLLPNNKIDFTKQLLTSDYLKNENPLLLNPEIDCPENYFIFLNTGKMDSFSKNKVDIEKADATLKICDLNRDDLVVARKNKIDGYIEKIKKYLLDYDFAKNRDVLKSKFKDIFTEILENSYPKYEYSRLHYFIILKIDEFIFSQFDSIPRHKQLIVDLYAKFKKGQL